MQFTWWHRSIALIIVIALHASLLLSFKTIKPGTITSGLEGIELSYAPTPTYSDVLTEDIVIDETEVIAIEEEITPVEVIEVEPIKTPKNIPTYKAVVKPAPKKIAKTVAKKIQSAPTKTVEKTNEQNAQEASVSSGVTSDIGNTQEIHASYQSIVAAILQKHKKYPPRAVSRNQQGTVTVKFTIQKTGKVSNYELTSSSGFKLLDRAVIKMLKKATPLPPFPDALQRDSITLVLPVDFYLKS